MCDSLVCVDDYEKHAFSVLPRNVLDFYKTGAGSEITLADNRRSFSRYKIRPRFLRDVSQRDLSTTILNEKISMPIGIAPTSLQKMAHPEGELASAKAAELMGTIFILSTASTSTIEEVASAAPNCVKWFQLYIFKDRSISKNLIERCERAGYKALVVTIDLPILGRRRADLRNKFSIPPHLGYANYVEIIRNYKKDNPHIEVKDFVSSVHDSSLIWEDIQWLKSITKLPIILKGILTVEDAILASKIQIDGIIVSNHGGRQLDGTPTSIDVLEEIVQAVGSKIPIYMDGGIREGTDIFKALALGAKMVFIGRPTLWGLTYRGKEGVINILRILKHEFDTALALTGCRTMEDIKREMVVRTYSKL